MIYCTSHTSIHATPHWDRRRVGRAGGGAAPGGGGVARQGSWVEGDQACRDVVIGGTEGLKAGCNDKVHTHTRVLFNPNDILSISTARHGRHVYDACCDLRKNVSQCTEVLELMHLCMK